MYIPTDSKLLELFVDFLDLGVFLLDQVRQNIRQHADILHEGTIAIFLESCRLRQGNGHFEACSRFFVLSQKGGSSGSSLKGVDERFGREHLVAGRRRRRRRLVGTDRRQSPAGHHQEARSHGRGELREHHDERMMS